MEEVKGLSPFCWTFLSPLNPCKISCAYIAFGPLLEENYIIDIILMMKIMIRGPLKIWKGNEVFVLCFRFRLFSTSSCRFCFSFSFHVRTQAEDPPFQARLILELDILKLST